MQKSSNDLFSRIFESSREFKKVTTITTCAMFGALSVVLGYYSFKITPNLKIGFGSIPNMLVDICSARSSADYSAALWM